MKRVALDFDCKQVADNVRGLGRMGKWESRSDEFPFFTLGKSAYLDGNSGTYYKGADGMNLTLFRTFNSFYKEVAGKLSTFLGEWVVFNPKLALPGFHIFPADPKLLSVSGNWHLDSPHETLGIGDKDVHAFTIAVEMKINMLSTTWEKCLFIAGQSLTESHLIGNMLRVIAGLLCRAISSGTVRI